MEFLLSDNDFGDLNSANTNTYGNLVFGNVYLTQSASVLTYSSLI